MEMLLAAILVREIFTMTLVLKHTNYILLLSNTKIY